MKIKNLISNIGAAFIVALSLVGCSDYDNGYTEEQLKFIQGFKDVFGEIDHSNDWNLAERGSVTVTTSKPSRIKIYANTFGTYKIVGDYEDVNGTQTLGFDMVEGTTDIMVSDGQSAQKVKVGDAVTFAGTRYVYTTDVRNSNGDLIVRPGDADGKNEWVDFPKEDYLDIVTDKKTGFLPEGINNLKKVTQNFSYISQGPFTIYPIYINSSSSHILGVYWKGNDGEYHAQYVYRDNCILPTEEWTQMGDPPTYFIKDHVDSKGYKAKPITIDFDEGTEFGFFLEVYGSTGNGATIGDEGIVDPSNPSGFKCDNRDPKLINHCVYSDNNLNQEYKGQPLDKERHPDVGYLLDYFESEDAWAGTFTTEVDGNVVTYLAFEDWGETGEWDLNDLVFLMDGVLPAIIDNDAYSWVISCEDLGGTFDIDYNDVVLKVTHISGQTDLTITPLAAGGTLASFLYFGDGKGDDEISLGEIHYFFGQEKGKTSGSYNPVNVGKGQKELDEVVNPIPTLTVSPIWSLASFTPTTASAEAEELARNRTMGGFYVKVVPENNPGTEQYVREHPNVIQRIQNTVERNEDNVPYIICTPYEWRRTEETSEGTITTTGTYRWPCENMPMFPFGDFQGEAAYTGYSDNAGVDNPAYSFRSWVRGRNNEDHPHIQTSIYWYRYPNVDNTVGYTEPTESEGDEGGNSGDNTINDMYINVSIQSNNIWTPLFQSGTFSNTDVDIREYEEVSVQEWDYIWVDIYDYIYGTETQRKDISIEYIHNETTEKYSNFGRQKQIQIQGSGLQIIKIKAPAESGYGEKEITITFQVGTTDSGGDKEKDEDYPEAGKYVLHTTYNEHDYVLAYTGNKICIQESSDNNPIWTIDYDENGYFTLQNDKGEYVYRTETDWWTGTLGSTLPTNKDYGLYKFDIIDVETGIYTIYNKYNATQDVIGNHIGIKDGAVQLDQWTPTQWSLSPVIETTKKRKINLTRKK